jgi:hypothetical protein
MNKNEKNPELKSSRALGLNFERLANLGSSHVRLANIVLNLEISRGFARTWNWGGIHDGGELPHWAPHPATRGWPQRHRAPPLALPPATGGRPWPRQAPRRPRTCVWRVHGNGELPHWPHHPRPKSATTTASSHVALCCLSSLPLRVSAPSWLPPPVTPRAGRATSHESGTPFAGRRQAARPRRTTADLATKLQSFSMRISARFTGLGS